MLLFNGTVDDHGKTRVPSTMVREQEIPKQCHLTPVRMATTKKTSKKKCWCCGEMKPCMCEWGVSAYSLRKKNSMEFPQKQLKIDP